MFPEYRLRRLRQNKKIRELTRETELAVNDFIYPLFVKENISKKIEIKSMPGIFQFPLDLLIEEIKEIQGLNIPAVLLFGIPEKKDEIGGEAYNANGILQQAIRRIKSTVTEMLVIVDACFCEYTSHGHCGIIKNNDVDNDATLEILQKAVLSYAEAGADIIAPSGMMDGMVQAIRKILDANNFTNIPIMSYSAKYASAFYGPFRDAAESAPKFGNRETYQMQPHNKREAMREMEFDVKEGADIIMVKPALSYLDIIESAKNKFNIPIAAYNVSGEYSMIKAAGANNWINEKKVRDEVLISIKRAGADMIISYFAKEWAEEYLKNQKQSI